MKVLELNVDDVGKGGVYSLVCNFISHKPDDIKVDIASIARFESKKDVEFLHSFNAKVFFVGTSNAFLRPVVDFFKTARLLKKRKYDCVHIHGDTAYTILPLLIAAKISGIKKIIVHSHAAGVDGNHRKIKYFLHMVTRKYLNMKDVLYVACSDYAANWMFPFMNSDDVYLIKNGVDLEKFKFKQDVRDSVRKELGLENKFVVGHVGRFSYQKNHEFLINVFYSLHEQMPESVLLLVGEGKLLVSVKAQVHALGLDESVIFYGTSGHVDKLMQAMDVFVLPSHFEGLPIVGVEAQAAGLPCIFSDQITHQTKLIGDVDFLPIEKKDIDKWVNSIIKRKQDLNRDHYNNIANEGYEIIDTVQSFVRLYYK